MTEYLVIVEVRDQGMTPGLEPRRRDERLYPRYRLECSDSETATLTAAKLSKEDYPLKPDRSYRLVSIEEIKEEEEE